MTAIHRRRPRRTRRLVLVGAGASALALIAGLWVGATAFPAPAPTAAIPAQSSTPPASPPPISAAQKLLLTSADPSACAVSFAGDAAPGDPALETSGQRFAHLPIPTADGYVFAGWYPTAEAATAIDTASRINGADLVACNARRELTLHAGWMTRDAALAEPAKVPILMYHQFTDKPEGEGGWLKLNYYGIQDWRNDMAYIRDGGFYLPTWDELDAFIDGTLWLPQRSVIITDDDADSTWLTMAVPVVTEDQLLTTSFVITSARQEGTPSVWVQQRSHTHDMHTAGDNGKGRMVNWTAEQIAADLEASASILGHKEVVAYPYGHYDERSQQGVAAAGFTMAVTTEHGYVSVGSDKLALPRVRMNFGMTVEDLRGLIG